MQTIVELLFFQCCLCVGNMDANNCCVSVLSVLFMCGKYGCRQLLSCCSSSAVYVWEIWM